MCGVKRYIMVIEDFTNYSIYDNRASKFSNGIMYHKMQEREQEQEQEQPQYQNTLLNSSGNGSGSGGNNERFFYATYNPQTPYSSNRSYYMEGISVSKYDSNYREGYFVNIVNRARKFFCCG